MPVNVVTVWVAPFMVAVIDCGDTTGATSPTSGASTGSTSASASSMVSCEVRVSVPLLTAVAAAPPLRDWLLRPPARVELGVMVSVLAPSAVIWSVIDRFAPVPAEIRMMTAATPMRMPDIVSAERSLFASTPRTAKTALSRTFTGGFPPRCARRRRSGRRASATRGSRARRRPPRG